MSDKVYVDVLASFTKEGILRPREFIWEDEHRYKIEQIKNVQRAASRKAGGCGILYVCMVGGRECHLFFEENNKWFMERKAQ